MRTATVILLFSLISLAIIGRHPFSSKGEAREALVVKNMIEQGNIILPRRNGSEIPSKPPLFHWMSLGALHILGKTEPANLSEGAIRFPSVLGAFIAFSIFTLLLRSEGYGRASLLTVLLVGSTFEWMRTSTLSRVDMTFTALCTCALAAGALLLKSYYFSGRVRLLTTLLLGVSLALACLAKGPAGIAIPLVPIGLELLFNSWRARKLSIPVVPLMIALAIAILGSSWWYLSAYALGGEEFIAVQLMKENFARITGASGYEVGHEKPFAYGVVDLAVGFLPWTLLLPFALMIPKVFDLKNNENWFVRYLAFYSLVILLVFSISTSKRPVYFLPMYLPLATLIALGMERSSRFIALRTLSAGFILLTVLSTFVAAVCLASVSGYAQKLLQEFGGKHVELGTFTLSLIPTTGFILGLLVSATVGAFALRPRLIQSRLELACLSLALMFATVGLMIQPKLANRNSARDFVHQAEALLPESAELIQFRHDFFPTLFYASRPLPVVETPANGSYAFVTEADRRLLSSNSELLLTSAGLADDNRARLYLYRVGSGS